MKKNLLSRIQINRIYPAIIIGAILATCIFISPGGCFILILTIGTAILLYHFTEQAERNFILFLFLCGMGTRVAFGLLAVSWSIVSGRMLNYAIDGCPDYSSPYIFADSGYYTLRALFTSLHWQKLPLSQFAVKGMVNNSYGFSGFIYLLAAFFSLFGYSPISSRFINCFLGSLTAILVYSIVKNIFNEKPARLAAILTAFFPSMFLWSTTNLRETGMIFAVCLMLWSLVKFQKNRTVFYLIVTLLSVWFQIYARPDYKNEFIFIISTLLLVYIFLLFILNLSLRKRISVLFVIFIIGSFLFLLERDKIKSTVNQAMQQAVTQHVGVINSGGLNYKLLPEQFFRDKSINISFISFLKMLGKGWFHIMFEPLPGRVQTKSMLISFPQMLLWYCLMPFAVLGVTVSIKYRLKESAILMIYFLVMSSVLAVTGGNIGTVFRHRDVITPIFLIFAACGLVKIYSGNLDLISKDEI